MTQISGAAFMLASLRYLADDTTGAEAAIERARCKTIAMKARGNGGS